PRRCSPNPLFSYLQFFSVANTMTFTVRTAGDPASIVESKVGIALDRNVPVVSVKTQAEAIDQNVYIEGLSPRHTATTSIWVILISAVTLLAGFLPAHRASTVAPAIALRND